MRHFASVFGFAIVIVVAALAGQARGQGYGANIQNLMTPADGGMAGVSIAQPQSVASAIFGNPATLTQFKGTEFTMGGAWIEGYPTISNDGSINGGAPFSVTSRTPGFVAPAMGVTQDFDVAGKSVTFGMGLSSVSGAGAEYRGRAPGTILNNYSEEYLVLGLTTGFGVELTDRLSVGASATLGVGFEQFGFLGANFANNAMANAYALRATVGADYALNDCNTLGVFWQSPLAFTFSDAVQINPLVGPTTYQDLRITQPNTYGLGWANHALMDGNLLLSTDVYYIPWSTAALWQDVFVDQWAFAVGTQYTHEGYKFRAGYSYSTNPINHNVGGSLDGFPLGQSTVQLIQAAAVPLVYKDRLTLGVGKEGVMVPNLDVDLFGGVLFQGSDNFGPHTTASLAMYYLGAGFTWRFGPCSPRP
jgi:long-chain fatty acid transport protein